MTNRKLIQAVEAYFTDLRLVRGSGGATDERSLYVPLANLLNAVGSALRPKVFCVQELADQGAGHPDFGLYTTQQVQKGKPKSGQKPERGVIEVKPVADDAWLTRFRRSGEPLLGWLPAGAGHQCQGLCADGGGCVRPAGTTGNLPDCGF